MKIEIRKPQYLAAKESAGSAAPKATGRKRTPVFFRLLLASTYVLSGLAIWYVYQKFTAH